MISSGAPEPLQCSADQIICWEEARCNNRASFRMTPKNVYQLLRQVLAEYDLALSQKTGAILPALGLFGMWDRVECPRYTPKQAIANHMITTSRNLGVCHKHFRVTLVFPQRIYPTLQMSMLVWWRAFV